MNDMKKQIDLEHHEFFRTLIESSNIDDYLHDIQKVSYNLITETERVNHIFRFTKKNLRRYMEDFEHFHDTHCPPDEDVFGYWALTYSCGAKGQRLPDPFILVSKWEGYSIKGKGLNENINK